jgi:hypothetical protein
MYEKNLVGRGEHIYPANWCKKLQKPCVILEIGVFTLISIIRGR